MLLSKPKRILFRIIIPFTLLFTVATIFLWSASAYLITRHLDRRLQDQMTRVADVIASSSFVLNQAILDQLKLVIKTDIVLLTDDGTIIRSTFKSPDAARLLHGIIKTYDKEPSHILKGRLDGSSYRILIQPIDLAGYGPSLLSLWMPDEEDRNLTRGIIFAVGCIALFGIIAMTAAGFFIARTITAPVERLVQAAIKVADGDFNEKVVIESRDEIGVLAESFNQMTERIMESEKKLVDSEKLAAAGRMAAGFAHEIRNPLTSIKMMGQVLRGRLKGQQDKQEILDQFVKEIDRLDRIIQEMIDRARPTDLKIKSCHINTQIEEVAGVAYEGLSAQAINLRLELGDGLPAIAIDPEKIKQVLWNLILNAKDAMPKGGIIEIMTGLSDNGFLEVRVKDSGQGIRPDNLDMLFQPFFTTKPEGVGLGLTMSLKIIEQHGGKLNLKNRTDGRGVEASFYLPVS
jgi:signal transduction histidine kinase